MMLLLSPQDEHLRSRCKLDNSVGYYRVGKTLLHRLIMNAKSGDIIDHIDRIKTNCQRENLRFVTKSQNNRNRLVENKLGRGVYFDKSGNRYRSCISINNKTIKLGSFKTIEEAKSAYNKKLEEINS